MTRNPDTQPTLTEYVLLVALITVVLLLVFALAVPR